MPVHRLCVCRTCPRDRPDKSELSERLKRLLASSEHADAYSLASVECLGGCPSPCAVALDAPAKWRVRFTRLTLDHAPDLLIAAAAYLAVPDGYLTDEHLPAALRGHITARSPKRSVMQDGRAPLPTPNQTGANR